MNFLRSRLLQFSISTFSILALNSAAAAAHFKLSDSLTGNSMNVLIMSSINPMIDGNTILPGDEIAVFDSTNSCYGVVTWAGGNVAMTVWGYDPISQRAGFGDKELLHWRVWDATLAKESPAKVMYFAPGTSDATSDSLYGYNGISVLSSLVSVPSAVLPRAVENANVVFFLTGDAINYSLAHPEAVTISFFDLLGKCALVIARNEHSGPHRIGLRSLNLPNGQYVVRFKSGVISRQRTLLLEDR